MIIMLLSLADTPQTYLQGSIATGNVLGCSGNDGNDDGNYLRWPRWV